MCFTLKGLTMNFLEILADIELGIKTLIGLLPTIGTLVETLHPAAGQEAAKVTTAVNLATTALTAVGVTASTISALIPTVTTALQANAVAASSGPNTIPAPAAPSV
jgi:hypothetical protein